MMRVSVLAVLSLVFAGVSAADITAGTWKVIVYKDTQCTKLLDQAANMTADTFFPGDIQEDPWPIEGTIGVCKCWEVHWHVPPWKVCRLVSRCTDTGVISKKWESQDLTVGDCAGTPTDEAEARYQKDVHDTCEAVNDVDASYGWCAIQLALGEFGRVLAGFNWAPGRFCGFWSNLGVFGGLRGRLSLVGGFCSILGAWFRGLFIHCGVRLGTSLRLSSRVHSILQFQRCHQ